MAGTGAGVVAVKFDPKPYEGLVVVFGAGAAAPKLKGAAAAGGTAVVIGGATIVGVLAKVVVAWWLTEPGKVGAGAVGGLFVDAPKENTPGAGAALPPN